MFRTIVSILALTALMITQAEAAVLAGVEGAVSIARGGSVIAASEGAPIAPGESVSTGEGTVRIVYENGCAVQVGPRETVAVAYAPPCQIASGFTDSFFNEIPLGDIAVAAGFVILVLVVAVIGPQHSTGTR
ncbi:MAG: hypothetical protein WA791_16050 [Rhodomicrobium sp.]